MKQLIKYLITVLIISACGEGTLEVENKSYKPMISVDGFLIPGKKIERIHIFNNLKLDVAESVENLLPDPAKTFVKIIDEANASEYQLTFHAAADVDDLDDYYYEYNGSDLQIGYGKSYTLEVTTENSGEPLWARSTTTTPQAGFRITDINFNQLQYAQKDQDGDFEIFKMEFDRAPGSSLYVAALKPIDTGFDNFITDHFFGELTKKDYNDNYKDYIYANFRLQNAPAASGKSTINVYMFDMYFYSRYEVVIFAADENYREYYLTFENTQEPDGNFHEARFNFEGDGIGVFGSVVSDTTYIELTR